jgi:propanol-preferring alcohol dehydrogenase
MDCPQCRQGRSNICRSLKRIGFEIDGTHAEFLVVPEANLVRLPDVIPFDGGCILADAVASVYHALVGRAKLRVGDRVVLLGIGGVSIHGVQIARMCGAEVLATSRQPARMQKALEMGAARVVNPETEDLPKAVFDFTSGEGADVILDAIGLENSIRQAIDMLRPGGKVIAFGNIEATFSVGFTDLFLREKDILGVRANTKDDLVAVTALAAAGKLTPLVSRHFHLKDFDLAVRELESNNLVGRAVFSF